MGFPYRKKHPRTKTGLNPWHERELCTLVREYRRVSAAHDARAEGLSTETQSRHTSHTNVRDYYYKCQQAAAEKIYGLVGVTLDIEQPLYPFPPNLPDKLERLDLRERALLRYVIQYFEDWTDDQLRECEESTYELDDEADRNW